MTRTRHRRHACLACGQVFTAHFDVVEERGSARTEVPCLADGCPGVVVVSHPRSAFALWLEEL